MGGGNPILWFWPLSPNPSIESGLEFEVNGFEDPELSWPPTDPDRMPRTPRVWTNDGAFVHDDTSIEAFKRRQKEDLKRWHTDEDGLQRRKPFVERLEAQMGQQHSGDDKEQHESNQDDDFDASVEQRPAVANMRGEESWKNSEGESLADFGLDEDVEFYDEEDIPLSILMQRRNLHKAI